MNYRIISIATLAMGAAAAPIMAQTTVVVTPTTESAAGWYDNSTAPGATSIVASPSGDGDGSLLLSTTGGSAQPALININTTLVGGSLSSLASNGYAGMNFLQDAGAPGDPVFRLALTGVTSSAASSYITMGWYGDTESSVWQSSGNIASSGAFFLRANGGQIADDCKVGSGAGSFSDRMQTLSDWLSACNGSDGTYDLTSASVKWIQVDQGTWPGFTGSNNAYVDQVAIGYGGARDHHIRLRDGQLHT